MKPVECLKFRVVKAEILKQQARTVIYTEVCIGRTHGFFIILKSVWWSW